MVEYGSKIDGHTFAVSNHDNGNARACRYAA